MHAVTLYSSLGVVNHTQSLTVAMHACTTGVCIYNSTLAKIQLGVYGQLGLQILLIILKNLAYKFHLISIIQIMALCWQMFLLFISYVGN